ncbi:MAG TPA: flippase [Chloroflexia bacterium]|nr:flippase [Chloroflexia bacterium]
MTSVRRKIASNIFFLTTGQGLSWLLTSLYMVIVPRYLGPDGMGVLGLLSSIGAIVGVLATMGTNIYILREVARDPVSARRLVGPAVVSNLVVGFVCWGSVALIMTLTNQNELTLLATYMYALGSILNASISPLRYALQGMDKMQFTLFEALLDKGGNALLAVVVAVFNLGLVLLAGATVITVFPMMILYWWAFLRVSSTKPAINLSVHRELIKGGLAFLILDVSNNVYLYLDAIMLSGFTNKEVIAFYSVPTRLLGSLLFAPVIIAQALLPTLSRMAVDSQEDANSLSRRTLAFLISISFPIAVGMTVIAQPLINLLYGEAYAPSVPIMILIGWTAVPMYAGIGLYQILVSQGKQARWTKRTLVGIALNFGINLFMIPFFQSSTGNGGIGAAITLLAVEAVVTTLGFRIVGNGIVNVRLGLDVLKSLVAALVMGIVIWPLRDSFILIPIVAGGIIYGILAILFFDLTSLFKGALLQARKQLVGRLAR